MTAAETFERIIDELIALIVVLALVVCVLLRVEPGVLKDAFLLIIGYFFGAKGRKAVQALLKR